MRIKRVISILFLLIVWVEGFTQQSNDLLVFACLKGNYQQALAALNNNANPDQYDADGFTALMYASDVENDSICELLLQYGATPDLNPQYNNAVPAITNVVLKNNPRILDLMLQYHGNPNVVDSVEHKSLLHYAAQYGYVECADVLLFHRANPNIVCNNKNPLQIAVYYQDTIFAQLLLDYGAKINHAPGNITPLCIAIQRNDYVTASWLIRHGANVNAKSQLGTPIIYSAIYADAKMSELLRSNGADISALDLNGNNAAVLSKMYTNHSNAKFFENQGIKSSKMIIPSGVSLAYTHEFCHNEYRMGFRIGIHELRYNTAVYVAISFRPSYKISIVPRAEKSYWQLRQRLTMMQMGIEKRISFRHQQKPDIGAYIGYQFAYGSGKYDGAVDLRPKSQAFHSPSLGLYQRFSGIGISAGYKYYGYKDMLGAPNNVAEIALSFYFNANRKKDRNYFRG